MVYLYAYVSTLVVFLLCDMAWLGTMASRLYRPTLGDIMLGSPQSPRSSRVLPDLSRRVGHLRGASGTEIRKPG